MPNVAADHAKQVIAPVGLGKPLFPIDFNGRTAIRTRHTRHVRSTEMGLFKDAEPKSLSIPEALPQVSHRERHLASPSKE